MNGRKIVTLLVTLIMIVAIFIGAQFGKTQTTILNPGMLSKYASSQSKG